MVAEIKARGLAGSTVIVLSAKHGQGPNTPSALTRIPDGPIIAGSMRPGRLRIRAQATSWRSRSTTTAC